LSSLLEELFCSPRKLDERIIPQSRTQTRGIPKDFGKRQKQPVFWGGKI